MATAFLQVEERVGRGRASMLLLCAGAVMLSVVACMFSRISINLTSFAPIGLVLFTATACWRYTAWRGMKTLQLASEFFLASTLISISVLLYSYTTLRAARPLADDFLTGGNAAIGYHFQDSFFASRQLEAFELSLGLTSGVITFPSIHAAIAILCVWASWPIPTLRAPMLLLNAAMFFSTIPVGAHYGVDLIGGSVLAVAVIAACRARKKAARPFDQTAVFVR